MEGARLGTTRLVVVTNGSNWEKLKDKKLLTSVRTYTALHVWDRHAHLRTPQKYGTTGYVHIHTYVRMYVRMYLCCVPHVCGHCMFALHSLL